MAIAFVPCSYIHHAIQSCLGSLCSSNRNSSLTVLDPDSQEPTLSLQCGHPFPFLPNSAVQRIARAISPLRPIAPLDSVDYFLCSCPTARLTRLRNRTGPSLASLPDLAIQILHAQRSQSPTQSFSPYKPQCPIGCSDLSHLVQVALYPRIGLRISRPESGYGSCSLWRRMMCCGSLHSRRSVDTYSDTAECHNNRGCVKQHQREVVVLIEIGCAVN